MSSTRSPLYVPGFLFIWLQRVKDTSLQFGCLALLFLASCRSDVVLYPGEDEGIKGPSSPTTLTGLWLLNEGNMGSNKCSLDFLDLQTGTYHRNIYGARNPSIAKDLGDVGNDLQVYGSRLWAVINCSNKVEVMHAASGERIGQVDIPNCRFIAFHGRYAYVTSYAGPVSLDGTHAQRGYVAKVDTATLAVVDTCLVGYQPDDIAVADGRLWVANSGGYQTPAYETELSIIPLESFSESGRVRVGVNPARIVPDGHGQLWVTCRGDYAGESGKLCCVDAKNERVTEELPLAVSTLALAGDSLYVLGSDGLFGIIDVRSRRLLTRNFITDGTQDRMEMPYGLAVNPETREVYVTDARNYVSPGRLYCFNPQGQRQWDVRTGDIPAHIAFLSGPATSMPDNPDTKPEGPSPYIYKVWEYRPAPGQFVGLLPRYEAGDTEETMRRKAEEAITGDALGTITLGAWGGYVTFGFDHEVENRADQADFKVLGNAFINIDPATGKQTGGSAEPGILQVSHDTNGNGLPDDPWYEIQGSNHLLPTTRTRYAITYTRPAEGGDVSWEDNEGRTGFIAQNAFHTQPYYPEWLGEDRMTFSGTCLSSNVELLTNGTVLFHALPWGYADNQPNRSKECEIDIDWAVTAEGQPARLPGIHFVRVYTGVRQYNPMTGESSTEVCGAVDLHLLK